MTCPKAWVLTYGQQERPRPAQQRAAASSNHLHARIRAGRTTMIERFEALYNGEVWTEQTTALRLKGHLEEAMIDNPRRRPPAHHERTLHLTLHQLRSMKTTRTLRRVFQQRAPKWAYFPRHQSMSIHGIRVFAAPDLMVHHQGKWTLIRIRFGPRPQPRQAETEARLMVHWVMAHKALPSSHDAYRIRTLSWDRGAWVEHRVDINQDRLEEAWGLLSSDVYAMARVQRLVQERRDYASVPLANSSVTCTTCRWKPSCLGERTLTSAKRDQLEGLLAEHHKDAIRSDKTASTS